MMRYTSHEAYASVPSNAMPAAFFCPSVPAVRCVYQVRTRGILWRPVEVRLHRFTTVVDVIVRLQTYVAVDACRCRPPLSVCGRLQLTFYSDCTIVGDFYRTDPRGRWGRPAGVMSGPRETIRRKVERWQALCGQLSASSATSAA